MKSILKYTLIAAVVVIMLGATGSWAANPDKVAFTNIATTPGSTQSGGSGNYTLTSTVNAGDSISLSFTLGASGSGSTSTAYPRTVNVTASIDAKPSGASDVSVTGLTTPCTFPSPAAVARTTTFNESATITAPATLGAYTVRISADDNDFNGAGKINGDFIHINFTVVASGCTPEPTTLELGTPDCVVLHATSVTLSATLTVTSDGTPLAGKTITFSVDGDEVGTADTDSNGEANLDYDPSSLTVGDHALTAAWQSDDDCYQSSEATGGKLGVQYLFVGFQPPINADGSTILTGKCGPVKIVIVDANGVPVPDATALVFFEDGIVTIVGIDPENATAGLNFDYGNVMRYSDGQYVYNWDLSTVTNGTKKIRVYLWEGSCAPEHQVVVSVGKKKK
jgi:hypothetical protein